MKSRVYILFIGVVMLIGCFEKNTTDPSDAFKYWAGTRPPENMELTNGQYWESAHWTKEYIVYLKFKPSPIWLAEYIRQNSLFEYRESWKIPTDAPEWFRPPVSSIQYGNDDEGSSCYFKDTLTGICYIYEIQL
jgi:hypothetical protein